MRTRAASVVLLIFDATEVFPVGKSHIAIDTALGLADRYSTAEARAPDWHATQKVTKALTKMNVMTKRYRASRTKPIHFVSFHLFKLMMHK